MRLAVYRDDDGRDRPAAVVERGDRSRLVDLTPAMQAGDAGWLREPLVPFLSGEPAALAAAARLIETEEGIDIAAGALQPPIARPGKLLAAAANYQSHILEGGLPPVDRTRIVPKLFMKPASALLAPGAPLVLPEISRQVDWELELCVVIGRRGRRIAPDRALEHVGGYTIINDVSARTMEWGLADREPTNWDSFFDWLNGKWPDGFAPLGPWIVTADGIPDPQDLELGLRLNGELRQHGSTAEMLFSVAELVTFASTVMTLEPGDLIATGTPAGVGDTTRTYLKAGDLMEGSIDRIGTLTTPVVGG